MYLKIIKSLENAKYTLANEWKIQTNWTVWKHITLCFYQM